MASGPNADTAKEQSAEEFLFFHDKKSPLHPLHRADFEVNGIKYRSIDQYLVHQKAVTFNATKIANDVLKCKDDGQLRRLEKQITGDAKVWEAALKKIIQDGYLAKALQCSELNHLLYETAKKGNIFVYANPKDALLGIGVQWNDPLARRRSNWKGQNLLGACLMEVRKEVIDKQITAAEPSADAAEGINEKFTFFWQTKSLFSQWHPCRFTVDKVEYNCAEQYMMHQKAVFFQDKDAAQQILECKQPKEQKELGREVRNFRQQDWDRVCVEIVRKGNLAKFSQDRQLKEALLATAGTTVVEASPLDAIWGIGLAEDDTRAKKRKTWKGKNLLGQILTEVREELMAQSKTDKS